MLTYIARGRGGSLAPRDRSVKIARVQDTPHAMTRLLLFASLLTSGAARSNLSSSPSMVGLSLVQASPSEYMLVSVDQPTGEVRSLGEGQPAHTELAGTGDLCAVDPGLGVFYCLGMFFP